MSQFYGEIYDVDSTSASLYAYFQSDTSGFAGTRYVRLEVGDVINRQITGYNIDEDALETEFEYTFSGLRPNTTYDWSIILGYRSIGESSITWLDAVSDGGSFTTTPSGSLIEPWSWKNSNGDATASQTQAAYDVLMGNSTTNNFSHKVWNDFVDKVMEMRTYIGDGTWDRENGKYLSYSNCKVSVGDTLSANIYNSVKTQIGSVSPTDILDVSAESRLTGYHIIHLVDVLNDIIADL